MHLILILDGYGYNVVKRYKEAGGFKGFHEPSAVVAPYPSMTDLCIEDLLGGEPCEALEAHYYDTKINRTKGGKLAYLLGQNQPYRAKLDYRAASWIDALCYVAPWLAFKLELRRLKLRFAKAKDGVFVGYLVATAGIGTKYGAAGQNMCLGRIDELCAGLKLVDPELKITLVSDHGHGYVRSRYFDIRREFGKLGWRFVSRLGEGKELIYPAFGLVHCAGFHTKQPAQLANDLIRLDCTELVTFKDGDRVAILAKDKLGHIWQTMTGFAYLNVSGDPLDLDLTQGEILELSNAEWLDKILVHHYPCAPERLWRAHTDLVQNTPDVIVDLKDGIFFGSRLLGRLAHVESTHGGLNRSNSLAFAMTDGQPLAPVLRSRETLDHIK